MRIWGRSSWPSVYLEFIPIFFSISHIIVYLLSGTLEKKSHLLSSCHRTYVSRLFLKLLSSPMEWLNFSGHILFLCPLILWVYKLLIFETRNQSLSLFLSLSKKSQFSQNERHSVHSSCLWIRSECLNVKSWTCNTLFLSKFCCPLEVMSILASTFARKQQAIKKYKKFYYFPGFSKTSVIG